MIPTLRDAAQQALDDLEDAAEEWSRYVVEDTAHCTLLKHLEPHINALRAALAEQPAGPDAEPAIPPGYKLVPVEPTPAMLVAINWPNDPAGYRAMLAAAPEAPQPAAAVSVKPVAWVDITDEGQIVSSPRMYSDGSREERPLYTAPQPAKPPPLAIWQIAAAVEQCKADVEGEFLVEFARAIERAHGIGEQP